MSNKATWTEAARAISEEAERIRRERRSHECGACGGDGGTFLHAYAQKGCNCPDCGGPRCPVCLGKGTIPEPTEAELRRDAIASAETLRSIARSLPLDDWDAYPYPDCAALRCVVDPDLWARGIFHETAEAIAWDATEAAHEALRAVPALRGER